MKGLVAMSCTRRSFLAAISSAPIFGCAFPGVVFPHQADAAEDPPQHQHLVTLSFDDGFRKSFLRTAEIYEKFKLSACFNVVAAGLPKDAYIKRSPLGDFQLWNELKQRGHEVMPHGYRHANLRELPLADAQNLVRRCLDVFAEKLDGFDARQAIFNFPYNASSPELEQWLTKQVLAFRTSGPAINRLPHPGQVKLTCVSFGPGNCEAAIDREIEDLLGRESGWLIFNTHGLEDEGWGPMRASYLESLLERLIAIPSVQVLPAGKALATRAE